MPQNDAPPDFNSAPRQDRPHPTDILSALRLLSRLPLPQDHRPPSPNAAWAWPLAGAGLAALATAIGMAALPLGAGVAAAVMIGAQAILTGAMHEDGLADTADGLWGGWDKARRLAIMKDSHIGSYGVMALLVVGLIRWSALSTLLALGEWPALIALGALSRAPMAALIHLLPNARGGGLSALVGRPAACAAGGAVALAALAAGFLGAAGLAALGAVALVTLAVGAIAHAKIGGQTGDILGASQQLAEATGLAVLAAALV